MSSTFIIHQSLVIRFQPRIYGDIYIGNVAIVGVVKIVSPSIVGNVVGVVPRDASLIGDRYGKLGSKGGNGKLFFMPVLP